MGKVQFRLVSANQGDFRAKTGKPQRQALSNAAPRAGHKNILAVKLGVRHVRGEGLRRSLRLQHRPCRKAPLFEALRGGRYVFVRYTSLS